MDLTEKTIISVQAIINTPVEMVWRYWTSVGFDFQGIYVNVIINELIEYIIDDGRIVKIVFTDEINKTKVVETFEAENTHSIEMQRSGWQSILDSFKKYAESKI